MCHGDAEAGTQTWDFSSTEDQRARRTNVTRLFCLSQLVCATYLCRESTSASRVVRIEKIVFFLLI